MLSWVNQFNICCFLDNQQYNLPHHSIECMAAAGAVQTLATAAGTAFEQLQAFYKQHGDWLFGHLSYDLNNETDGLTSANADGICFPDLCFFVPEVVLQLSEYFEGKRTDFTFKMNPKGTDFQKKVCQELLKIPFGKTASYQKITNKLGDPKAIRAVANANGKNPLWIVVPCHRVIGSDGSLTGYAGGLWRKKWLLEHENPIKQQSLF